ncbi:MAG: SpoIID/LytB domain-containing protein [Chitinivibrionia bacterium]|nr:SpoIID/LytB domain-containing protein [Chitinivibrionia bacterium]
MKIILVLLLSLPFFSCYTQSGAIRPSAKNKIAENTENIEFPDTIKRDTIIAILPSPVSSPSHSKAVVPVSNISNKETENKEPMARILLHKNMMFRNFFVYGKVQVVSKKLKINVAPGSIRATFVDENNIVISAHGHLAKISVPCTLSFVSGTKKFIDDEKEYRGGIIFTGSKAGFSVCNYIGIEDYLRGVVPLEIGVRAESDFEALKAQAVAARTYAFSRILSNKDKEFDLYPTVADQVYDGSANEYKLSDSAIISTKGIVITRKDGSLLDAYYHATCAGKTAAIDEVWNSRADSSLASRNDFRETGEAFCRTANSYFWKETWSISHFSQILRKYSRLTTGEMAFDGTVRDVRVLSRTSSGRVAVLQVISDNGAYNYGKDKARFVLRRPTKDEGILKSANFDIKIEGSNVVATGIGFGHGIGMCQNGTLERARAGQDFKRILSAYYSQINFGNYAQ